MKRLHYPCLAALLVLAACGASTRTKALQTAYQATQSVQAGLFAWSNLEHGRILESSRSKDEWDVRIAKHREKVIEMVKVIASVYSAIAYAGVYDNPESLVDAVRLTKRLLELWGVMEQEKL